jgi:hypothetical protein
LTHFQEIQLPGMPPSPILVHAEAFQPSKGGRSRQEQENGMKDGAAEKEKGSRFR